MAEQRPADLHELTHRHKPAAEGEWRERNRSAASTKRGGKSASKCRQREALAPPEDDRDVVCQTKWQRPGPLRAGAARDDVDQRVNIALIDVSVAVEISVDGGGI